MATKLYKIDEIKREIAEAREQCTDIRRIVESIDGRVYELSDVWEDVNQTRFAKKLEEMWPELDCFCASIEDYAKRIEIHMEAVTGVLEGPV